MNAHKKWEYRTWLYDTEHSSAKLESVLNIIGNDGWEMVSSVPDDKGYVRCFFKREVEEKTPIMTPKDLINMMPNVYDTPIGDQ